jgi:hypothetical protein
VLAGRKTVTRRLARGICRYRVGQDYSVQPGRGVREIGRLAVVAIARQQLGLPSLEEVRREGFDRVDDFIEAWTEIHGGYDEHALVDRIAFHLVSVAPEP